MVGIGDVKRWNTGQLDEIFTTVQQQLQVLVHSGDDFSKALPVPGWTGDGADNATAQHQTLIHGLDTVAAGTAAVQKALGQAADAITSVQAAITNAENLAHKYGYQITDAGRIIDTFAGRQLPSDLHPEDRARVHQQLVDEVAQAMRTADDIDNDLATVLRRAAAGQVGTGDETTIAAAATDGMKDPGLTLPEPPPNATPSQNAAWWATLSPAGRAILIHDRPAAIGAMDGLPATDRDTANRAVFNQEQADLQHQRDDLQHRLDGMRESDPAQEDEYHSLQDQISTINDKLQGMDQISDRLEHPLPGQPPAYLLGINTANAGQAVIAVGNPDNAQNVATYVPGTFAGLDGIGTDIHRADVMGQAAQSFNRVPTSVITWVGYDAPQSIIPDAASTGFADHAETGLRRFQDGLDAAHGAGPMNTTVIGHSYGTTVVGQTARDLGLPANNLVMVASPGVGVQHANDLHLDGLPQNQVGQHIYSTKAATDPIPAATNFDNPALDRVDPLGPDPTTGWFGGQRFESNSTSPITSHSDYWNPLSSSLREMGKIIAGGH